MAMTVIFLGPAGSGKGTQASRFREKYRFVHFDIGAGFRESARKNTDIGRKLKRYLDRGMLVPIDLVKQFVKDFFLEDASKDIILDGFPRSIEQAEVLEEILSETGRTLNAVIFFDIAEPLIEGRILTRVICTNCGAVYNLKTRLPQVDSKCDVCGSLVQRRTDDNLEVLSKRVEVYRETTEPLIEYYSARGLLKTVDAGLSPDEVFKQVEEVMFNG